ncbi:MAG: hypothetical protein L3J21_03540 [Devosiaceae bacterium]|nr:hypothetical protein [Devosiaceae bacterium]
MKAYFTYVWGGSSEPAWPLTFTNKSTRNHAVKNLVSGDLVYTVGTKSEPTPKEFQGRVLGVYRLSDLVMNTADYQLDDHKGVERFPYALHPLEVWAIDEKENQFSKIVGPLTPNHHLQAQTKVMELDEISGNKLSRLARSTIIFAKPVTALGQGKVKANQSKLGPKHSGRIEGSFHDHDVWFVYSLVLRNQLGKVLAIKVGYSHDPLSRECAYNKCMANELTGLRWERDVAQPMPDEDAARKVEQGVLKKFRKQQIDSNGEILNITDTVEIMSAIGKVARSLNL